MYWIYTILALIVSAIAWITFIPSWLINHLGMIVIDPCFQALNTKRKQLRKERRSKYEKENNSGEKVANEPLNDTVHNISLENDNLEELKHLCDEEYIEDEGTQDNEDDEPNERLESDVNNSDFDDEFIFPPFTEEEKIKPKKWLYPEKYSNKDFSKTWNARKLVKAIAELETSHISLDEETDDFEFDVKRARVAAVLRAYTGQSFSFVLNNLSNFSYGAFCDKVTDEQSVVIMDRLKSVIGNNRDIEYLERRKHDISYFRDAFHTIYQYRTSIEKAMDVYSGILESSGGWSLGIKVAKSIYNPVLEKSNEEIENLLILLLGDSFNMTFKEVDLIRLYNYPTVTDSQIFDWVCDNM